MLGNRVNDLETRLSTQGKLLAERDFENNQLRQSQPGRGKNHAGVARRDRRRQRRQGADDRKTALREGRGRGTARHRPRRARQAAARHQRDPAAGRKFMGDRAHGKCAAARAHQRYRRRSRQTGDAARRAEFADRGHAGRRTGARRPRRRAPANGRPPMAAFPRAAARWPSGSGRCNPMPPAPASRGRELLAYSSGYLPLTA